MTTVKENFIRLCLSRSALLFGDFTLKSGRRSPYFFNAGRLSDGEALCTAGTGLAQAVVDAGVGYDMLFGPAYKGIPLVTETACALWRDHRHGVPFAFNRKEAKQHGDGGILIGAPLRDNVLLIDDVITAGTAVAESAEHIKLSGATLCGIVVMLDRQETIRDGKTALEIMRTQYGVPVISLITLRDIIDYLAQKSQELGEENVRTLENHYRKNREQIGR